MPRTVINWTWEEGFQRYGFDDGNGWIGTYLIEDFLENELGCDVDQVSGSHNSTLECYTEKEVMPYVW